MEWFDTHAHIFSQDFEQDLDAVMERARAQSVQTIAMPNIDETSVDAMLRVAKQFPSALPMLGLHPCSVKENFAEALQKIASYFSPDIIAIGEVGTDLYWDKTYWAQQQEAFLIQVQWAIEKNLPLVIHCRNSIDETLALLQPYRGKVRGVFHCFSGNGEHVRKVNELDFYFGLGGVVTFKNSGMDGVLPHIPLDKMVLETDAPYLAPTPYRGKRNEPSYLPRVAEKISEVLRMPLAQLAEQTTANAKKLFQR